MTLLLPRDETEAADMISQAAAKATPLNIVGSNSKASIGRPAQSEVTLSSSQMTGITLYEPAELVVSARAGTPVSEVVRVLAENGQDLPFEPLDYRPLLRSRGEPTIGAVVAANLSGSRRIYAGAARDSLIGLRFINGRGEQAKSGGRVMKNVTGLDLVKLLAGSWGTLAFLTEVTFKILPKAERASTLILRGLGDAQAIEALTAALGSPFEVTGAAHLRSEEKPGACTLIRLEGFSFSVDYRIGEMRRLLKPFGAPDILEGKAGEALWQDVRNAKVLEERDEDAVWRISTAPSRGPSIMLQISKALPAATWCYDWGGGLIWVATNSGGDAGAQAVREAVRNTGGHAMLVRAAAEVRASVDVFDPPSPALLRLSAGLKASFDPARIFNPGRMYAGI